MNKVTKNNTMYKYSFMEHLVSLEGETHKTYAIVIEEKKGDEWVRASVIHDVTSELDQIKSLVKTCEDGQLHPIHLLSVVEDFIGA